MMQVSQQQSAGITQHPPASVFLNNMRTLWMHDPTLAHAIDAIDDSKRYTLQLTQKHNWTTSVSTNDNKTAFMHSRYDPVKEAEKLAESVSTNEKFCFVMVGTGLGYHVRSLYEKLKGDFIIICLEPDIYMLATAFSCVDFSDMINSGKVLFIYDDNKSRLHEILRPHSTLAMLGTEFVKHIPSIQANGQLLSQLCQSITEYVTYCRISLLTLVGNSEVTCRNIAMNFPHAVTTPPVSILHNRFHKNPAIIISAGPSLHKNINKLGALKNRAVLCAVQTTLRPLLEKNIVPDFVTCLDYHEMSQKFYENVPHLDQVHMVAEPKATWHVLDKYPGPVSILGNDWMNLVLGEELGNKPGLKAGATVAHLAFYLATYMGCDPIIFVGQDLAFTGHVFYVPGVEIHKTWFSELNRYNTMEMKEWDRIARNGKILRKTVDTQGKEIYTDELLFTYLEQFEKDITQTSANVINATEGGAHIRGTTAIPLDEVINEYCNEPIDEQRYSYRTGINWRNMSSVLPCKTKLLQRLDEFAEVREVCKKIINELHELKQLVNHPDKFNRKISTIDELRTKVSQNSMPYRIINQATQLAELQRFTADRKISASDLSEQDRASRQITRDIQFIQSVHDGAIKVSEIIKEAEKRMGMFDDPNPVQHQEVN